MGPSTTTKKSTIKYSKSLSKQNKQPQLRSRTKTGRKRKRTASGKTTKAPIESKFGRCLQDGCNHQSRIATLYVHHSRKHKGLELKYELVTPGLINNSIVHLNAKLTQKQKCKQLKYKSDK